jgi:hypothetical protein
MGAGRRGATPSRPALPHAHRDEVAMLVDGVRPDVTISASLSRRESCKRVAPWVAYEPTTVQHILCASDDEGLAEGGNEGPTIKDARLETDLIARARAVIDTVQRACS